MRAFLILAFPFGGSPPKGGGEGRSPFLIEIFHRKFSNKGAVSFALQKNFQSRGQLHFRFKSFRTNQSRPSFASLSLATFPPRGRLNFRLFHGFPLPEKKFSELHFFRQKWESFPYVKASPCFFLLSQKSAKIVSRYAASPRGEAPPRGGGEEKLAFLFCLKICLAKNFQTKGQLHLPCKKIFNQGGSYICLAKKFSIKGAVTFPL